MWKAYIIPTLDGEGGRTGDAHALDGVAAHVLYGGLADDDGVHGALAFELVLRPWEQLLRGKTREWRMKGISGLES